MEELKKNKKAAIAYAVICLILLTIIIVLMASVIRKKNISPSDGAVISEAQDRNKKLFDTADIPDEIVTINTQIIEDGLKDMGVLITEEYYFTQVEEYSSSKKVLIFDSKSSFTYSYDGTVSAGIDCNNVKIAKDDEAKTVTITIPKADIVSVNIDKESFKIYEEKEGLWNKTGINDFNDSLIEFENAAKAKALEKGIIDKADEGAEKLIASFVDSLIDSDEYTVTYVTE
ncbi:MAG: DUF4230 domain-containing protein [Lachnospiraceae bacterium]|nr:DUF4230 domain-containing protein [Lachnospiraceae bacterium]